MLLDLKAARAFLAGRADVVQGRVGIAGASIGANLAVLAASADPTIRSIALLSPGLDYRNLHAEAALRKYGDRPALMIASEEDSYAMRSIRKLEKAGNGKREVRRVNAAGHGTAMLSRQPDLVSLIVEWFQRTLG
jgi:dienelactone hydrolase